MSNIAQYQAGSSSITSPERLNVELRKFISVREVDTYRHEWRKDEYGDNVEVRVHSDVRYEISLSHDLPDEMREAMLRPCQLAELVSMLHRLAVHKTWARGEVGWKTILKDLNADLSGVSGHAVFLACEFFRQQPDLKYFPDTAKLVCLAKEIDWQLQTIEMGQATQRPTLRRVLHLEEPQKPRRKKRAQCILQIHRKSWEQRTIWEQRFWNEMQRRRSMESAT